MHRVRKKRLIVILSLLIGGIGAVALLLYALGTNLNHFFTPSEIVQGRVKEGQNIRVGGLVREGSVARDQKSLKVSFDITDNQSNVTIEYKGILPDLFREGQGIVVTGRYAGSANVIADEVLAKHDENYMPPEALEAIQKAGHPAPVN